MRVEVALCVPQSVALVNGKEKDMEEVGQAVRQSPFRHIVPEEKLVEVACEVVALEAVKFWKVVEPLKRVLVKVAITEVKLPMMPVLALRSVVEAREET